MKMAFQYWHNLEMPRKRIVAFENAYHGDTFGAMAVSGRSAFTAPFVPFLFDVDYLPVPTPGQHTDEVLGRLLGYDRDTLGELRRAGAIA